MKAQKKPPSKRPSGKFPKKAASKEVHPKKPADCLVGEGTRKLVVAKEPSSVYSVTSKLRDIGNSKGVILNNRIIAQAGITSEVDLIIHASDGVVIIQVKDTGNVNTDLSSWDAQYKKAIKKGKRPEGDMWEGLENKFDQEEWT